MSGKTTLLANSTKEKKSLVLITSEHDRGIYNTIHCDILNVSQNSQFPIRLACNLLEKKYECVILDEYNGLSKGLKIIPWTHITHAACQCRKVAQNLQRLIIGERGDQKPLLIVEI
jgi:hypothetical protein